MGTYFYFDLDNSIVIQKISSPITKIKLIKLLKNLYQQEDYLKIDKILTDFRGVEAEIHEDEIEEIAQFIKLNSKNTNNTVNAILVDMPVETAFIMLYKGLMHDLKNYYCSVCCTEQKAAEVLGLNTQQVSAMLKTKKGQKVTAV